jgi:hypothetical protein
MRIINIIPTPEPIKNYGVLFFLIFIIILYIKIHIPKDDEYYTSEPLRHRAETKLDNLDHFLHQAEFSMITHILTHRLSE